MRGVPFSMVVKPMRKLFLLCGVLCSLQASALTFRMPPPGEDIIGEVTTVRVAAYEAEADAGRQDLAERADVEHHARGVGRREREARRPVVVELVVVVVLEQREAGVAREREQRGPTWRSEGHGGGVLVVRRHVHGAERSVADGSRPVEFPDFTRGRWKTTPRFEMPSEPTADQA